MNDEEYRQRQEIYGPTDPEIRKRCLEVQKTWSDWERAYRAGLIQGEPRNWRWCDGRPRCYEREFFWTPPQFVISVTMIGKSDKKRRRETVVWRKV